MPSQGGAAGGRLRGLLVNLTLAVVSVLVLLVVMEVGLRFAGFQTRGTWTSPPYDRVEGIGHLFKPGYDGEMYKGISSRWQEIPVHTNSHGLRGEDFPVAKPSGEKRVLVVGDSFAFGYLLPDDETFPTLLQKDLSAIPGIGNVRVINGGVPGYGIRNISGLLQHRGFGWKPDVVVMMASPGDIADAGLRKDHDAGGGGERVNIRQDLRLYQAVRSSALMNFLQYAFFRALTASDPTMKLDRGLHAPNPSPSVEQAWGRYRKLFEELVALSKARGIPFVVVTYPGELELYADTTVVRDRWKEMATSQGAVFVDVLVPLKEHRREDLYLPADGHPAGAANAIVAAEVAGVIAPLLSGQSSS